jgi:hypothetical protein
MNLEFLKSLNNINDYSNISEVLMNQYMNEEQIAGSDPPLPIVNSEIIQLPSNIKTQILLNIKKSTPSKNDNIIIIKKIIQDNGIYTVNDFNTDYYTFNHTITVNSILFNKIFNIKISDALTDYDSYLSKSNFSDNDPTSFDNELDNIYKSIKIYTEYRIIENKLLAIYDICKMINSDIYQFTNIAIKIHDTFFVATNNNHAYFENKITTLILNYNNHKSNVLSKLINFQFTNNILNIHKYLNEIISDELLVPPISIPVNSNSFNRITSELVLLKQTIDYDTLISNINK